MSNNKPLCVELDSTLIKTNLMEETFIKVCKTRLWLLPKYSYLYVFDRRSFIRKISSENQIEVDLLPLNRELLEFIKNHPSSKKILITDSWYLQARKIANYSGVFDELIASDEKLIVSSESIEKILEEKLGKNNFEYISNNAESRGVLKSASRSYTTNKRLADVALLIEVKKSKFTNELVEALRIQKWKKNLLIFLPLLFFLDVHESTPWMKLITSFFSFCFMASSIYIFNDIIDIWSDRRHLLKKQRPIASGSISISCGLVIMLLSFAASGFISLSLVPEILLPLICYLIGNITYSLKLKTVPVLNLFALTAFYLLRFEIGFHVLHEVAPRCFLPFLFLITLGWIILEEFTDLKEAYKLNGLTKISGRVFGFEDLQMLQILGVIVSVSALLILLIMRVYSNNNLLLEWVVIISLGYLVSFIWLEASKGKVKGNAYNYFAGRVEVTATMGLIILGILLISEGSYKF